jgi:predicted ATPase
MERARNVRPGIVLDGEASSVIQAICEKLDGLPLAIELAAAQVRVFPVRQLLEQLQTAALPRLVGGARDLPARQQTIRATIDWSYRLLTPAEQVLFARVGVFVGGGTLEAVEAIDGAPVSSAAPSPALPAAQHTVTTERLLALVDHGLVQVQDRHGRARYTLLETVREYALERLRERGEEQELRWRHAGYFTGLAEKSEPALYGPQAPDVLRRLRAELDNIRAALAWSLEQQPELAGWERPDLGNGRRSAPALA